MFTESQQRKLSTKFTQAISTALDRFPGYLHDSEPDAAAEIIAGIIKAQISQPTPPPDPASGLDEVMRRLAESSSS